MKLSCGRIAVVGLLLACTSLVIAASAEDQLSSTNFVVLKDDSGKPVRNAAVILHPVGKRGKQLKTGFELKTDAEGKTHFDGVPFGPLRVQVIAHGFQTFGDDFEINQVDQQITIRLKRPKEQYSIYGKDSEGADPNAATGHNGTTGTTPQK